MATGLKGTRIGLIVNPLAGIGGRVGLKGSDGRDIVDRALALGATPTSSARAVDCLSELSDLAGEIELGAYPAEMGAAEASEAGFEPAVMGAIESGHTTAMDTRRAAAELRDWGAHLVVFAGGDGTARDVADAIGISVPSIGIPAGVKIHSSVYAVSPRHAAEVIRAAVRGQAHPEEREVLDIDEGLFRSGVVAPRLYGYLLVPCVRDLVQRAKVGSRGDPSTARGIALAVEEEIERDPSATWILGPGSTVKAIGDVLAIDKTLLGIDVYRDGRLIAKDVGEAQLLATVEGRHARMVVTVIGGQGYLFGRGNQQLSPAVIRAVGKQNLLVVATLDKLHELGGPLRVDTGDQELDRELEGYVRVVTGPREAVVWKVSA